MRVSFSTLLSPEETPDCSLTARATTHSSPMGEECVVVRGWQGFSSMLELTGPRGAAVELPQPMLTLYG